MNQPTENQQQKRKRKSSLESIKRDGNGARGTLAAERLTEAEHFTPSAAQQLKFHGVYQQDDRDLRRGGSKEYSFFVRTRLPGGTMTAMQFLSELELCERFGNGTLRLTDRQGVQIHGVLKRDLRTVIREINRAKATSWGACGDVLRNVMCCPAPMQDEARSQMRKIARLVSSRFTPASQSYWELWLQADGDSEKLAEGKSDEEPFYGSSYLPRKFKIGFATPDDNCIDVLTHDLGFVSVVEQGRLIGFNAYVGGGMGVTPARKDTFAAVAQPIAFVKPAEVLLLSTAVISTHRDHGNREDRKLSRLRYLIADWGAGRFREHIDERFGGGLKPARELAITGSLDHLGWHLEEHLDGKRERATNADRRYLGVHIPSGRIQDTADSQLKSALRQAVTAHQLQVVVTPQQNLLLTGIAASQREAIERQLANFGVSPYPPDVVARRQAIACPALPTCGLAITESERILPSLLDAIETVLRRHKLEHEPLSIRVTGCPNGCTRPYVAEVGIVGKAQGKYTLFFGGSREGTRLGFIYRDSLSLADVINAIQSTVAHFAAHRRGTESFGDFCHRVGRDALLDVPTRTSSTTVEGKRI